MFVQPSGLIFLVIIAIWATYLLQHWVRRREHLATARSVDRFSDAMRVLERHVPLPELDVPARRPRSYAVSPARPSRPEVTVKRIQAPTFTGATRPAAAVRAARGFHARAGMSARRVRGLTLLVALSLVVVVSPLAALSLLPGWSFPVVIAVLAADFAALRHAAVAEQSARRTKASAHRARAAVRLTAGPAPWIAHPTTQPAARPSVHSEPIASAAIGVGAVEPHVITAQVDPSGWAPVPVPPPTYTLKAKAERPAPAPASVVEPAPTRPSSFDGLVDDDELDGLLDRRAAGA